MNKNNINPFVDNRKIPTISVNFKVKINDLTTEERDFWNLAFGYINKKPKTKLDFLVISIIRKLDLYKLNLNDIEEFLSSEEYIILNSIRDIFDNKLSNDLKAFILGVLHINYKELETKIYNKTSI